MTFLIETRPHVGGTNHAKVIGRPIRATCTESERGAAAAACRKLCDSLAVKFNENLLTVVVPGTIHTRGTWHYSTPDAYIPRYADHQ